MGSRAESCRLDCGRGTDLRRGLEFVNHVPMGAESQARAVAEAARDVDDAGRSVRRAGKQRPQAPRREAGCSCVMPPGAGPRP